MPQSFAQQRQNMVDGQIKPFSVIDTRILDAFSKTPREAFVPENRQGLAYLGEDLAMGDNRFLIEPPAYARLLQEANIDASHHALDVGCLTGYTSVILATLAKSVVAIDSDYWITQAKHMTKKFDADTVDFVTSDLKSGSKSRSPFEVIVINGAVEIIPPAYVDQLKDGGRIATFIRNAQGNGHAVLFHKHKGGLHQQILFDAFVPALAGFEKPEGFTF